MSVVNSMYDPLGFLSPVILLEKLLLRDLFKEKEGWDDEISSSQSERWYQWLENFAELSNLKIKRCVKPAEFGHTYKAQ